MLYQLSYLPNPGVRAASREPRAANRISVQPRGLFVKIVVRRKNERYGTEICLECQVELPGRSRESSYSRRRS